ncbi:hypothetical protein MBLNU459_g5569t2 [Dothideomycetes sp. NU459]
MEKNHVASEGNPLPQLADLHRRETNEGTAKRGNFIQGHDLTTSYRGEKVEDYIPGEGYDYCIHEALPRLPGHHPHSKLAETAVRASIDTVINALQPCASEDLEVRTLITMLKGLCRPCPPHVCRFATIGDTGTGKSTLINSVTGKVEEESVAHEGDGAAAVTQVTQEYISLERGQKLLSSQITFFSKTTITDRLNEHIQNIVSYKNLSPEEQNEEENEEVKLESSASYHRLKDMFPDVVWLSAWDMTQTYLEDKAHCDLVKDLIARVEICQLRNEVRMDEPQKELFADTLSELREQLRQFTVPGLLSWTVEHVRTSLDSCLLDQGVELADVPGIGDTDRDRTSAAMSYLKHCPGVLVVARVGRAKNDDSLDHHVTKAIRTKGIENVCLVLTHKEVAKSNPDGCNQTETAHLGIFQDAVTEAQTQLNAAIKLHRQERSAAAKDRIVMLESDVERSTQLLTRERILLRDRKLIQHCQSKYQDPRGSGRQLNVVLVSNETHQQHLKGYANKHPLLGVHEDGICNVRKFLTKAPSEAKFEALKKWIQEVRREFQRVRVSMSEPRVPRIEAIRTVFDAPHNDLISNDIPAQLRVLKNSSATFRDEVIRNARQSWNRSVTRQCDKWENEYVSKTIGAFVKKGGIHRPRSRRVAMRDCKTISMNGELLKITEEDLIDMEYAISVDIESCKQEIKAKISIKLDTAQLFIEGQDEIGGGNLTALFELFLLEQASFVAELERECANLKECIQYVGAESTPFVSAMQEIYDEAAGLPRGTQRMGAKRMEIIREKASHPSSGPYIKMADGLQDDLDGAMHRWEQKVKAKTCSLFNRLRKQLDKVFQDGERSAATRERERPEIAAVLDRACDVLDREVAALIRDCEGWAEPEFAQGAGALQLLPSR